MYLYIDDQNYELSWRPIILANGFLIYLFLTYAFGPLFSWIKYNYAIYFATSLQ